VEVKKIVTYEVNGKKYDTEKEAKEAMYREFLLDIMADMNGNDCGIAGALKEVLVSLRDMRGLSKQKLQKLIDVLDKMSKETGGECED